MEILDPFDQGLSFIMRWGHFLSGITWIGILYFFNFVQVPAYAELSAGARNEAIENVTRRALWWFRFGAMFTLATGLVIIGLNSGDSSGEYAFDNPWGTSIFTGALLGIVMFLNVWLVIWPNQQIVLANARNVLAGGEPDGGAPAAGRKALMASRTNAFFSIPMLWYMGFTTHFSGRWGLEFEGGELVVYWIVVLAFVAFFEAVALGFVGGFTVGGPLKYQIERHRDTIIAGIVATVVLHVVLWEILLAP